MGRGLRDPGAHLPRAKSQTRPPGRSLRPANIRCICKSRGRTVQRKRGVPRGKGRRVQRLLCGLGSRQRSRECLGSAGIRSGLDAVSEAGLGEAGIRPGLGATGRRGPGADGAPRNKREQPRGPGCQESQRNDSQETRQGCSCCMAVGKTRFPVNFAAGFPWVCPVTAAGSPFSQS